MGRCAAVIATLLLIAFPLVATETGGPRITFTADEAIVTGFAPGGSVALLVVGRTEFRYHTRLQRSALILKDDARSGRIELQRSDFPPRGVWSIADMETGKSWTGSPTNDLGEFESGESKLQTDGPPGQFIRLVLPRPAIDFMLVRPGSGAWLVVAREGGVGDEDRRSDAVLRVTLAGAMPVGSSGTPPNHMRAGDVLMMVDPYSLAHSVFTIGKR
jgi:hypothetical protein